MTTEVVITKKLPASVTLEKGMFVSTISTDSVDRDGEVLVPSGCNIKEFMKSATVFYNHEYTMPIGKCVAFDRREHEIVATTKLADRPSDYVGEWFPDFVRAMVEQGIVKCVSVGFSYATMEAGSRIASSKDIEMYGPEVKRVTTKWKLREYSIAPLQANPDAVVTAVGKGLLTAPQVKRWLDIDMDRPVQRRHVLTIEVPQARRPQVDYGKMAGSMISDEIKRRQGFVYV